MIDKGDDSDNETRSSFDFTQELNRLNKGGARQSFVKQLQNVFRPPTGMTVESFEDIPPVPTVNPNDQVRYSFLQLQIIGN